MIECDSDKYVTCDDCEFVSGDNCPYQQGRAEILDELLSIKDHCEDCYMEFCESCKHNGEYSANIQKKLEELKGAE